MLPTNNGGASRAQAALVIGPFSLILMDGIALCSSTDAEGNRK